MAEISVENQETRMAPVEWVKLEKHSFSKDNFYRIVNKNGYKDFVESGVLRSSPTGTESNIKGNIDLGHRQTSFPSFNKGIPNSDYLVLDDNYIFEIDAPMYRRGETNPVTGNKIRGRHFAHRMISEDGSVITEIKAEKIKNIYKFDKDGNLFLKSKD
jgi:hypothetical protein